ncbi:MAG: Maf family protein [Microthrixaceae bacterium]|nr:Maf family protein [Microthrixaceae bacterium]
MSGPATPTLIALHGHGDDEENTLHWARRIVPATWRLRTVSAPPGNSEPRSWFDTTPRGVDRVGFDRSLDRIREAVAEAAEHGPVAIAGFSQGAAMALGVPSLHGLVGIVGVCGFLPEVDDLDISSGPPVLLAAGDADDVTPAFLALDAAAALTAAGREATTVTMAGGHEVSECAAHHAREWLDHRCTPRHPVTLPELVLASGSPYRARMLSDAGYKLVIDPPDVDERAADHLLDSLGPGGLAMELARRKAVAVAPRHRGSTVLAGDQVGVVGGGAVAGISTTGPP